MRQLGAQGGDVVPANERQAGAQVGGNRALRGRALRQVQCLLGQLLQRRQGQRHDAAGTVAHVEQPLQDAQLLHVGQRVGALAARVALRRRKAIAALPHAQRVLAQAGVAFDGGDRQAEGVEAQALVHIRAVATADRDGMGSAHRSGRSIIASSVIDNSPPFPAHCENIGQYSDFEQDRSCTSRPQQQDLDTTKGFRPLASRLDTIWSNCD